MTTQFLELYGAGLKNTADVMSAAVDAVRAGGGRASARGGGRSG